MTESGTIETVVRGYVEGMVFADEARLRQAFHPSCAIVGHMNGKLAWLSVDDFVEICRQAGPAPADERPEWDIQTADVTGDLAVVKVADTVHGMNFTDYLTLIREDGGWRIIHKGSFRHP